MTDIHLFFSKKADKLSGVCKLFITTGTVNPSKTGNRATGTLANSEGPGEMPHKFISVDTVC